MDYESEGRLNILLVKLSALGDVIHTLPSLAALRGHYPEAHLTWVVEEAAADLIRGHPCLDRVIVSRRKTWLNEIRRGRISPTLREIRAFLRELRDRPYDLVIDFHGLLKSSLLVALSRGKRRLGYDSWQELSGLFLNEKVPEDLSKHAVDRYLDLVYHLGVSPLPRDFLIDLPDEAEKKVAAMLNAGGIIPGKPFIVISPLALWETKLWSDEGFADVASAIGEKLNLPVVLVGSDRRPVEGISSRVKGNPVNLAGETSLKELACLLEKASLVLSTDSGPMHLAAAVGTPVVALFGPTDPKRTGPYGEGHKVIRKELPCSPCFLKRCKTRECMIRITPEEVFDAVCERLTGDPAHVASGFLKGGWR